MKTFPNPAGGGVTRSPRSWLFAPGHNEKLLAQVFEAGADVVLLDLEDAVPPDTKDRAREMVAGVAATRQCWVRVNRARSEFCERDLEALAGSVLGFRIPKVDSADDVAWVADRAPGVPLDCTIESARGVLAAFDIASAPACALLSYGGLDLAADLGIPGGEQETLYARSYLIIAARSAGKPQPSDGVHPLLDDDDGLRREAEAAKRLGFFGKSAIHPRQVPIIHQVFASTPEELEWARQVLWAFEQSGGAATKTASGEFVDSPVAKRARQILGL
ncbi:MAG TPA: CoA ester lyase [Candidatus Dormibacteraeota bacterium]|nr:CoA ester lyase [Candidatus Dormibacteraeota bacterium]